MKKVIKSILLLFGLETVIHIFLIFIYVNFIKENHHYIQFFESWNYLKLKLIFYLLPYFIVYTHILKSKKKFGRLNLGFLQMGLFVGLSLVFSPITIWFFNDFKSIPVAMAFLFASFITPVLLSNQKVIALN